MIISLLISLFLTETIEVPFSQMFSFLRGKKGLLTVALANVVTNPALVFCMRLDLELGFPLPELPLLFTLELTAFIVEGLIYRRLCGDGKKAFAASLTLNGISFFLGRLVSTILKELIS